MCTCSCSTQYAFRWCGLLTGVNYVLSRFKNILAWPAATGIHRVCSIPHLTGCRSSSYKKSTDNSMQPNADMLIHTAPLATKTQCTLHRLSCSGVHQVFGSALKSPHRLTLRILCEASPLLFLISNLHGVSEARRPLLLTLALALLIYGASPLVRLIQPCRWAGCLCCRTPHTCSASHPPQPRPGPRHG